MSLVETEILEKVGIITLNNTKEIFGKRAPKFKGK
jgi:hypothetical protein